jgi:rubrerythrin
MLEEPTLRKAVEFAVETERLGAAFYVKLAEKFVDAPDVALVFTQLAKDEIAHQEQFTELLEQVPADPTEGRESRDQLTMLRVMSRSEFFVGEEGLYSYIDTIRSRQDALERALRLEKDLLAFYVSMEDILGENAILSAVIASEKQHILKLAEYLITGAEMRGLGDGFSGGSRT